MDCIHIDKLIVRGKHGVMERERHVEQEFEISLRLGVGDTSIAAHSENLRDAVDYQPIKDSIVKIIEHNSFYLIEKLADTIAKEILKDIRIQTLELSIKKPEVWESGVPGLTIIRRCDMVQAESWKTEVKKVKLFSKDESRAYVQAINTQGVTCVPECLSADERVALIGELGGYQFVRQPDELGSFKVQQDFSSVELFPSWSRFLMLRDELQDSLQELFSAEGELGKALVLSKPLQFNEVVVQQYEPTALGISPHRDGLSRINLVAVLVLEGRGRFCVCDNRAGENARPIRNEPGDLLLMRGPGFLGSDILPFHFVDQVEEKRTTFALRQ